MDELYGVWISIKPPPYCLSLRWQKCGEQAQALPESQQENHGVGKERRGGVQRTRRVWGHHGSCRLQEMWGPGLSQTGCSFMF